MKMFYLVDPNRLDRKRRRDLKKINLLVNSLTTTLTYHKNSTAKMN